MGFEPTTVGLEVRRSFQTELRALEYVSPPKGHKQLGFPSAVEPIERGDKREPVSQPYRYRQPDDRDREDGRGVRPEEAQPPAHEDEIQRTDEQRVLTASEIRFSKRTGLLEGQHGRNEVDKFDPDRCEDDGDVEEPRQIDHDGREPPPEEDEPECPDEKRVLRHGLLESSPPK